ncbi:hypothetical protein [Nocardioides jiangxiensis]|uniref:ScoMcrA-like N-terminal head domain-containing protein n=1 Tax=Nocardioides jiangxiensis TaxID=3064524 RepID=A0ABT9AYX5_9ACTN|nr:hypothetical protein [Nocardioides sp. WY-20]MDO7867625.1 hypothetical protein [Nocardioides sp. WY-20]
MQNFALVTRIHVLTAIKVHDQGGAQAFVEQHGLDETGDIVLVERGKRYDYRALLAFAHGKATGTTLDASTIGFDRVKVLTDLGFTVASASELDRPAPTRGSTRVPGSPRSATPRTTVSRTPKAPAAAPKAPAKPEPEIKLCPSCFTQLPASGQCDFCE